MAQANSDDGRWEQLVDVAAEFALKHPDAVLVGGTVAALYAGHRVSTDLSSCKRLDVRWQGWEAVRVQLRRLAVALTEAITGD
jgi:hypothetical protein